MRELSPEDRIGLAPLFAGHRRLRAVVDAVLEGRLGRAYLSDGTHGAARLSIGCYEIFGGAPDADAARELAISIAASRELVFGNDPAWRSVLQALFGERLVDRPMKGYVASARADGAGDPPAGFELVRMDARLAAELDSELAPHAMQVFESARDFERNGAGFAVVSGGRVASAATTYAIASSSLEVAIATRPAFRGRGLAFAAARALLSHAAERNLAAHWNASNPISQRLAARLGMREEGVCEVLLLP